MTIRDIEDTFCNCPNCDCDKLEYDTVAIEGSDAYQKVWCPQCGLEWFEVYEFSFSEFHDENAEIIKNLELD